MNELDHRLADGRLGVDVDGFHLTVQQRRTEHDRTAARHSLEFLQRGTKPPVALIQGVVETPEYVGGDVTYVRKILSVLAIVGHCYHHKRAHTDLVGAVARG
jgi:hypothetical protein